MMDVIQIDLSNKAEVEKFIRFPFTLYKKCKYWVPPLLDDMRKNLDPQRHPFYQHSEAAFFMVVEGEKPLGRITVMENKRFNEFRNAKAAFFGYFDSIEDEQVSNLLFKTISDWAKDRGLNQIRGPKGLLSTEAGGVLVDGFAHMPALTVAYNYPYYDDLIQKAGFQKETDHLSGYLPANHVLPERILRIAEKVKERRGFWIKNFETKDEIKSWIHRVAEVYSKAFSQNYSFIYPTDAEIEMIAHSIISIADPPLVKIVMKGNDVIGFLISYHDLSRGIQRAKGELMPFGWFWILLEKRLTKWLNINGGGVLPEYQGSGATTILYTELQKSIQKYHFKYIEVVQVDERNHDSFSEMEKIGVKWYKRHRNYVMNLQ
ncbi:MAG: hypothetical protein ACPL0B_00570 [Anaerolineales bacterium]